MHSQLRDLGVPEDAIGEVLISLDNTQQVTSHRTPQDIYHSLNTYFTISCADDLGISDFEKKLAPVESHPREVAAILRPRSPQLPQPPQPPQTLQKLASIPSTSTTSKSFLHAVLTSGSTLAAASRNHPGPGKRPQTTAPQDIDGVTNSSEFTGDHRFPPGRPPLDLDRPAGSLTSQMVQGPEIHGHTNKRGTARLDQNALVNEALEKWPAVPLPRNAPKTFAEALAELGATMRAPVVGNDVCAVGPSCPTPPTCNPASFHDPEHTVTNLQDCQTACKSHQTKVRYLTNGDANRQWGLRSPMAGKVSNAPLTTPPPPPAAGGTIDKVAPAPSYDRETLTAAQHIGRQEMTGVSLQLAPREPPVSVTNGPSWREAGPLVQYSGRVLRSREARGADLDDHRLHATIFQLMVQVGPLQMRVLAWARTRPAGDQWMRPRLNNSSHNVVRRTGGACIGGMPLESYQGAPLSGDAREEDSIADRGPASGGNFESVGGSARIGGVGPAADVKQALMPRRSLRQILQARQQVMLGTTGKDGVLVGSTTKSGGRSPAHMQRERDSESPQQSPLAAAAGGGDYPHGAQAVPYNGRERTKEHAPGRRTETRPSELQSYEVASTTTGTSTDHDSAIQVRQPADDHEAIRCIPPLPARPPRQPRGKAIHEQTEGQGERAVRDLLRFSHEGRPTPPTLSERKQFGARHIRRAETQPVNLTISIARNERGRRIAESTHRNPQDDIITHSVYGTEGCANYLATLGPRGRVSGRFPARANRRYPADWISVTTARQEIREGRATVDVRAAGAVHAAGIVRMSGDVRAAGDVHTAGDMFAIGEVTAAGDVRTAGDMPVVEDRRIAEERATGDVCAAGDVHTAGDVRVRGDVRAMEDGNVLCCTQIEVPPAIKTGHRRRKQRECWRRGDRPTGETEGSATKTEQWIGQVSNRRRRRRGRRGGKRRGRRSASTVGDSVTETGRSTTLSGRHGGKRDVDDDTSRTGGGERLEQTTPLVTSSAEGEVSVQDSGRPAVVSIITSVQTSAWLERDRQLITADEMARDPEATEVVRGVNPVKMLQLDLPTELSATWSAAQQASEAQAPVADSIEVRLVKGTEECKISVRRKDWSDMQDLELGPHVGLALRLAYHRSRGGRQQQRLPNLRFIPYDGEHVELGRDSRPSTWEDMVGHTERGGFYRIVGILRGGMEPELEQLLDSTAFVDNLPWNQIDEALVRVRNGNPFSEAEAGTDHVRLAKALASSVALQQWEPLAAFLSTRPPEERAAMTLSPARLAALSVVVSRRPPAAAPPPQVFLAGRHVDLRFNHLHLNDFVPDAHLSKDLRGELQDAIVDRVTTLVPNITTHPYFQLSNLRDDTKVELNYRDPGIFSVTMVLPNGQWVGDFYLGNIKIGRDSFCTLVMVDAFIEVEVSNADKQLIRAVRQALAVDRNTFRRVMDASLDAAIVSKTARFRETTARYVRSNGKGKGTLEHVSPDSPESSLLVSMDANSLLLARRTTTRLAWRLGNPDTQECPVTIGFSLPRVPHHVQRGLLTVRDPAIIRTRVPGSQVASKMFLIGPLPKGSLPENITSSGARMATLRDNIRTASALGLQTTDARLVGRYEKNRSPMLLYLEFNSLDEATRFATMSDQHIPPALQQLLQMLFSQNTVPTMQLWECSVLAETLAGADEKTMKQLLSHGQPAAPGTGAAAGGPDNPEGEGH